MAKKFVNKCYVEGYLYDHTLEQKVSGPNSKNPGTQFISGTISIATDDAITNIIPINFTYVTAINANKGTPNATYSMLNDIMTGKLGTVMNAGKDVAAKLRVDTSIDLNEFYSDRSGTEELVSVKRYNGGFIHTVGALNEDEKARNIFEVDIIINGYRELEADEERGLPAKGIVKGAIFGYKNALLPVEFSLVNPNAMAYFSSLEPSSKNMTLTRVKGRQISETVTRKIVEESAFGESYVREVNNSRKDFVLFWAQPEPYVLDDESTITFNELSDLQKQREMYLANIKQRQADFAASRNNAAAAAPVKSGGFNF